MLDSSIEQDSISALQFMRGFSLSIYRNSDDCVVICNCVIDYRFEIETKLDILIFDEGANSMVASSRNNKLVLGAN